MGCCLSPRVGIVLKCFPSKVVFILVTLLKTVIGNENLHVGNLGRRTSYYQNYFVSQRSQWSCQLCYDYQYFHNTCILSIKAANTQCSIRYDGIPSFGHNTCRLISYIIMQAGQRSVLQRSSLCPYGYTCNRGLSIQGKAIATFTTSMILLTLSQSWGGDHEPVKGI